MLRQKEFFGAWFMVNPCDGFAPCFCEGAWATNGMNMIGVGAVSSGMGGADLAVVDNASAMNINPSGICSCDRAQFSVGLSTLMPEVQHQDSFNALDSKDQAFPLPLITYATPIDDSPLIFGLGLFAQGGMGVDYDGRFVGPGGLMICHRTSVT